MSSQFLSNLSQNFIELLKEDEYYDITIEVGEDPNVKIFRAHMNILCCRSLYLRRTLASNKKNNDNVLTHLKLSNISPDIFQILLKYIYGGIFSLDEQDTSDIFKVLITADQLHLQELVDYLQIYFIENKSKWMEQHFELIHQTSFQSNNLLKLQQFCTDFMAKSPDKIFESFNFNSLTEKSLVSLIKRDDLQMKEVVVWKNVLKWGIAQNQALALDPVSWSDDDFKTMENTLQNCLPLIRFFSLSSKEFLSEIRPYKKLLNQQLYEELLNSYMDQDSEPNDKNISLPRNIKIPEIIFDSNIVNINIISIISRWIDKMDFNSNFSYLRELYFPYKLKLLLRGSRDGFTHEKFHELCDDKPNTVTFIKVKGTEEILGGYNPLIWKPSGFYFQTKYSFIFSFKSKNSFKDAILSNVEDIDHAINNRVSNHGPFFGDDLIIWGSNKLNDYDHTYTKKVYYEKKIRDVEAFVIEDYEVFQLFRK